MVAGLNETDTGESAIFRALHDSEHQAPPYSVILDLRVDGNRPDAGDRIALVKEAAAHHAAIQLGHEPVKAAVCEHHR